LTDQLTGISEDDLGSILIRPAFHYCELLVMRHAKEGLLLLTDVEVIP
jgi:hypothetical protein